jgi:hypothetical protein
MAAPDPQPALQEIPVAKPPFDAEALIEMFENASTRGSAQLRTAVEQSTLMALQGREMTVKNIRSALESVAQAVTQGAAKNVAGVDPAALLDRAVQGMDDALLKAVQANRTALQQFVDRGADLREKQLKKAIDDLDKFEDMLLDTVKKAASASSPLTQPWQQMLDKVKAGGSIAGMTAASSAEELLAQTHGAMRSGRAASLRAAQAMADSYAAMVSGVLLGMTEAMEANRVKPAAAAPRPAAKSAARKR